MSAPGALRTLPWPPPPPKLGKAKAGAGAIELQWARPAEVQGLLLCCRPADESEAAEWEEDAAAAAERPAASPADGCGGGWEEVAWGPLSLAAPLCVEVIDLLPGMLYRARVQAVNACGASRFSDPAKKRTRIPPPALAPTFGPVGDADDADDDGGGGGGGGGGSGGEQRPCVPGLSAIELHWNIEEEDDERAGLVPPDKVPLHPAPDPLTSQRRAPPASDT